MALRKRSTVRRKKVSRASKRPRTTGSGKHPAASQKGERCRAHHNAKIADIRARHIPRRSARGRIPFGDGGTSVNSLRRHRAPIDLNERRVPLIPTWLFFFERRRGCAPCRELELLYENRREVAELLAKCYPAPPE